MELGVVVAVAFMVSVADTQTDGEELRMREIDSAMAATLIGALSFMMLLYWATNWKDSDIQKSTWTTIGTTISIFCAVLVFQEFHHVVKTYFTQPRFGDEVIFPVFLITFVHFVIWVILALICFMWQLALLFKNFDDIHEDDIKERSRPLTAKKSHEEHELNNNYHRKLRDVRCITELSGHLVGFAAINTFATFQGLKVFRSTIAGLFAVVISTIMLMLCLMTTACLRSCMTNCLAHCMTDSLHGTRKNIFHRIWNVQMKKAENDVVSLTVSFLIMQCVRLHITGCLPNEEGIEENCSISIYDHTFGEKIEMLIWFLISMFLALVIVALQKTPEEDSSDDKEKALIPKEEAKKTPEEDSSDDKKKELLPKEEAKKSNVEELWERLCECSAVGCAILFAWSLYYGSQMLLAGLPFFSIYPHLKDESMLLAVLTAVFVSAVGFALLLVLDFFADHIQNWMGNIHISLMDEGHASRYSRHFEHALRKIMKAVGIAIGISWEKCFDGAVDALSVMWGSVCEGWSFFLCSEGLRVCLCMYCVFLLVPSWRSHIKPFLTNQGWVFGYTVNIPELHTDWLKTTYDETDCLDKLNTISAHVNSIRKILKRLPDDPRHFTECAPDKATVDSLKMEIQEATAVEKSAQAELADVKSQVAQLEAQCEALRKERNDAMQEKLATEAFEKSARADMAAVKSQVAQLEAQCEALQKERNDAIQKECNDAMQATH